MFRRFDKVTFDVCHFSELSKFIACVPGDVFISWTIQVESGFAAYFSGFCEGVYSGFRYRFFVLSYYIFVSEITDICFAKYQYNDK